MWNQENQEDGWKPKKIIKNAYEKEKCQQKITEIWILLPKESQSPPLVL